MRISTSQFFQVNVAQMNDQQSQLTQLYQQIASGVSLSTPADNPLGAAQAVQLSATSATLSQYTTNQNVALTSLQAEDSALSSVTNVLNSIQTLLVRAGDSSLSDANRSALATQLQGYRDQLMTVANSTDSGGHYIFSGFQASAQPFANQPGGGVTYSGDSGTRNVQIADGQTVAQGDSGAAVFLSVPTPGAQPVPAAGPNNSGTATIGTVSVTDPSVGANGDNYTITFGGTAAAPTYTVTDTSANPQTTTAAQAYTSGAPISVGGGQTVAISGTPASGDTFTVTPAQQAGTDIFGALDTMISALQTPITGNAVAGAALRNAAATFSTKLANTSANVLTVHAAVGGREQMVQTMQTVTSTNTMQTSSNLSDLTSTDMVSTISQYTQLQNALTGAQKAFVQLQNLSLFQYINP
ncbi:flagellar hook-associated protein FlgL [Burkholderia guangdongensis]|uniref:flagellar hook-associated protein FlgL n=1 Tax=Burkholderia guangdongensis TaxID=1792500 RepID=UPI0015CB059F|nr:flagellar hook-associated protein FlgL [Burkholderia guangdongensis]